jgi:uncharacterized protein YkwD
MSALRRAAACLVLACSLVLPATSAEGRASASPMVERINDVRRAHGLRALRSSPSLARSSSRFARHLLRTDRFAHAARIRASGRFSRLGEILALTGGWNLQTRRPLGRWLGSASHRAVLLGRSFRYVGAAAVRGRFGGRRAVVWTVRFGGR